MEWYQLQFTIRRHGNLIRYQLVSYFAIHQAVVSPFGTGVSFVAITGRVLNAMERNGHIPKFLGKINTTYNIPRVAIVFNAIISMVMVTLFRDWVY